jgi:hypothetical protein
MQLWNVLHMANGRSSSLYAPLSPFPCCLCCVFITNFIATLQWFLLKPCYNIVLQVLQWCDGVLVVVSMTKNFIMTKYVYILYPKVVGEGCVNLCKLHGEGCISCHWLKLAYFNCLDLATRYSLSLTKLAIT